MRYEWFWSKVSPEAKQVGRERLDLALASLIEGESEGRTMPVTRARDLQRLAERYGADVIQATVETVVSPLLGEYRKVWGNCRW